MGLLLHHRRVDLHDHSSAVHDPCHRGHVRDRAGVPHRLLFLQGHLPGGFWTAFLVHDFSWATPMSESAAICELANDDPDEGEAA